MLKNVIYHVHPIESVKLTYWDHFVISLAASQSLLCLFPIKLYNNRLIFVHICQGVWWNKVYKMYYTISLKVIVWFSTYWFFSYRLYRRRLYLPSGFSRYEGQKTFLSETCLVLYMYIVYFSLICTSIFYSYYIRNLKY